MDFCLIFVPFGHYDEPEILPYAINSIRPIGADGEQIDTAIMWEVYHREVFNISG
jgi:hypothetical protein